MRILGKVLISMLVIWLAFLIGAVCQAKYENGIPVLLYHYVNDEPKEEEAFITVTSAVFAEQMKKLHEAGFQTIRMAELITYMRGGKVNLPDKPVVLTFDDGHEDNYTNAYPVMQKYGYTATFFMVGENIGRPQRLQEAQLRQMRTSGFDIGVHTMSHANLTKISAERLGYELGDAQLIIKNNCRAFAYPGGYYNLRVVQAVEGQGYQAAFTVLPGFCNPKLDNRYLLRRIPIFHWTDFDELLGKIEKNEPRSSLLDYAD